MRTQRAAFGPRRARRIAVLTAAGLVGATLPTFGASPAGADTFVVPTATEAALRAAFDDANANPGKDTIVLPTGAEFTLTDCAAGALVSDEGALVIEGNGATITQTCDAGVIIQAASKRLTIIDLTVQDGVNEGGGNILASGDLVLENVTALDGYALGGGNVYAVGDLTMVDSTLRGGTADDVGGNLYARGEATITGSTIADGAAPTGGGAFLPGPTGPKGAAAEDAAAPTGAPSAEIEIRRTTITGNVAERGGGLLTQASTVIDNATISGNAASESGGGIAQLTTGQPDVTLSLYYATVAANEAPRGANIETLGAGLGSFGSVIALPAFGGNCDIVRGDATSSGYNWSDDITCGLAAATDVQAPGADPKLGPLADNNGPTQTHIPLPGSPLKNAIPLENEECLGKDQRSVDRPQGPGCDIGSVEVIQPTLAPGTYTTPNTQQLTIDLKLLATDPDNVLAGGSTYTIGNGPNHGYADPQDFGIVTYDPLRTYAGPDGFDYEVCDEARQFCGGNVIAITVTGDVLPVVTPAFTG